MTINVVIMIKKPDDIIIGKTYQSKHHGDFVVLSYGGKTKVEIKFVSTGFRSFVCAQQVRSGEVRDRLFKSIFGVGYLGVGCYKSKLKGKDTDEYRTWFNMLHRCYLDDGKNPTYSECTVCEEWHNFQNFAKWYDENYPKDGGKYEIDKDLTNIGAREYNKENCMFVPKQVNLFVIGSDASRGRYMIGVCYHIRREKFQANCRNPFANKMDYLGLFDSEIDAHMAWRRHKSMLSAKLADMQEIESIKKGILNYKHALDNNLIHKY